MKKILFISAFRICNKTAGQNYTLQLLQDLSKDFSIDVINWDATGKEPNTLPENVNLIETHGVNSRLKTILYSVVYHMFPLFSRRFTFRTLRQIRNIAADYDYIYYDFSQVFFYSLFVNHPHSIKMSHDVIGQKYSRKKFAFLFDWFVKHSERRLLSGKDTILCFSDKDRQIIHDLYGLESTPVSFYINDNIYKIKESDIRVDSGKFVFFGAWNRSENTEGLIWFLDNVLPLCPSQQFEIIGGRLPEPVKERIGKLPNVEYLGFVDNPYPLIANANALIAPIFQGAGVKVKVIESLALGTPVIGTDVAFEGISIPQQPVRSLHLVSTPEEYAAAIQNTVTTGKDKGAIRDCFNNNYSQTKFSDILRSSKI